MIKRSCPGKTRDGLPCQRPVGDDGWCFSHRQGPEAEAARQQAVKGAGKATLCETCEDLNICHREERKDLSGCGAHRSDKDRKFSAEEVEKIAWRVKDRTRTPVVVKKEITPETTLETIQNFETTSPKGLPPEEERRLWKLIQQSETLGYDLPLTQEEKKLLKPPDEYKNSPTVFLWEDRQGERHLMDVQLRRKKFVQEIAKGRKSICANCGKSIPLTEKKRKKIFCDDACRVAYNRKKNKE